MTATPVAPTDISSAIPNVTPLGTTPESGGQNPLKLDLQQPPSYSGFPKPQGNQCKAPLNSGAGSTKLSQPPQPHANTFSAAQPLSPDGTPPETQKRSRKGKKKIKGKSLLLIIGGGLIFLILIIIATSNGNDFEEPTTSPSPETYPVFVNETTLDFSVNDETSAAMDATDINQWPNDYVPPTTARSYPTQSVRTIVDNVATEAPTTSESNTTEISTTPQTTILTNPSLDENP